MIEKTANYQHSVLPCGKSQFHANDYFKNNLKKTKLITSHFILGLNLIPTEISSYLRFKLTLQQNTFWNNSKVSKYFPLRCHTVQFSNTTMNWNSSDRENYIYFKNKLTFKNKLLGEHQSVLGYICQPHTIPVDTMHFSVLRFPKLVFLIK